MLPGRPCRHRGRPGPSLPIEDYLDRAIYVRVRDAIPFPAAIGLTGQHMHRGEFA